MRAAILKGPEDLRVEDVEVPSIGPDEVIVKVEACGICGSDVHYYHALNPYSMIHAGDDEPNPANMILGHEIAGVVVEDRSGVGLEGKRVGIEPFRGCGGCEYCRRGDYNLCDRMQHHGHDSRWGVMEILPGGFAELCPVWPEKAYRIPDSVSFDEATLLDGLAVGIHAIQKSGLQPGQIVAVLGSGPVGLTTFQAAKALGAEEVFVTDVRDKPLRLAEELGADAAIDAAQMDAVKEILSLSGGDGVDVVFDTVGGEGDTVVDALNMVRRGGTVVPMAALTRPVPISFRNISGERKIVTSCSYASWNGEPEFQIAIDLIASGKVNVGKLISHRFRLSQVNEAFRVATDREGYGAVKIVINP